VEAAVVAVEVVVVVVAAGVVVVVVVQRVVVAEAVTVGALSLAPCTASASSPAYPPSSPGGGRPPLF
jgi:hypothetical protein